MNKEIKTIKPFTRFLMTIGQLPSSYLISMTYEEQLLWFCNFLQNQVIPALNNNAEAVIELQEYVKNFFDNLDIQEEVNAKLDEMAESGELTEIIAEYLSLQGILAFNNITELKAAENLNEGAFVETFGRTTYNDGLGSKYKIRTLVNTDVIDDLNIIALTNYPTLVAERVEEDIILPFNTLNDLKEAENLMNGSFVETYGKNTYNDELGSKYKIRELEESDTIDEYNLISLTNYPTLVAERINEIKFKILSYDNIDFYVDGINGDDLNNGDSTHPFKTFNRFLEEFKNYAEIRCHFIGTANEYTMNTIETFNSIGLHLMNDSENANITINFLGRYTPAFYNSHLNVTGDSSHYITLNIPNKLYFDGGYTLCSYTKFTGNTLTLNGGSADFNNVEFNYPLFVNKSITNVNYCTFVDSYLESNNSQIYARGIIFNGTITSNPLRITWNSILDLRTSCTLNGTITNEFIYAEDSIITSSCTLTNNSTGTVNGLYIRNVTLCMNNTRYGSFNIGTIYKQHSRLLAETYQYLN